jgi:hypothetical protein
MCTLHHAVNVLASSSLDFSATLGTDGILSYVGDCLFFFTTLTLGVSYT